jgi:hypothetical protein
VFLDPQRWRGASLETIVTALVELGVTKRRTHRGLLRALALYVRSNPDPTFRERAAELNRFVTARLQALLASRHGEIRHPQPRLAIAFGLAVMDAVTREAIVFEDAGLNPAPMPDSQLARELTRAYLAYLGVRPRRRRGSGGSHAPRRKLRAG